jgi:hypothetical protein
MPPIKIPTVPKSAYDEDRPAGDLLLAHIANLERALGRKPKRLKGRLKEGEAAAYIRHLSRHLHHRVLLPTMPTVATPIGVGLVTAAPRTGERVGKKAGKKAGKAARSSGKKR